MPPETTYRFHPIHLHWLSLDVVAGAVVCHLAANHLPNGRTPTHGWVTLVLALVVFGIYSLDRLLDNRRPGQPVTPRHTFSRTYESQIGKALLGVLLLAACLSWLIPRELWAFGAGMVALVALYLWLVSRLPVKSHRQALKEPLTSFIYAAGVWGSTWFLGDELSWESVVLGTLFFIITLQSLLLFSHFESLRYREVYNLARWLQRKRTVSILNGITLLAGLCCLTVCLLTDYRYVQRLAVMLLVMSLAHLWMLRNPEKIIHNERFRMWGELVFVIPVLVL
ncbi:hypothetical protein GCM10027275_20910 [Rhabdobacter roseus]|uniref:Prenyltransferase n=1 Tax=Rhabdobacter roseus TaxID=1655419 RepID=A0A840TKT6_9BACT|nr:hypothetical protein [Rhabdobacter roseus]MBB5284024.1 hypothetical protein [Rhabdobacter roseus]